MPSFCFGLLLVVVITVCILALVKRYIYPVKAKFWREGTGLGKSLADMYDWIDGKGTTTEIICEEVVKND